MEIDNDSESNSEDYEENSSTAESKDPTIFFNSASPRELQEILRISEKQAKIIIEHRPYVDIDQLYTTLSKARSVSPKLITRYEELIEGYEAVDKLIEHCQNEAQRVISPTLSKEIFEKMEAIKQPIGLAPGFQLKGYQIAGVQWLLSLYKSKLKGGILADEVGRCECTSAVSN
jgi:SWI/SNF-related matrix-associated actin-dependent regulator 1 of chromatin subfamily A